MSRFKVTTYQWKEYPECKSFNKGYLVEAINSVDNNHDCLGHFEGIWGGKANLIEYLYKQYQVEESELVFIDEVGENVMTIKWKKLINFDVPQKLWGLAEKIANEIGWTTEAVLCDAAEKYLGYIEKDLDNEMISIQIPKSLYDRIETVSNKSVEREIQREMTEWVELVEEIYEDSDEEESVEPLLPPISDALKEPTQYYLVKYESDWADEMDIEGFDILTQEDKDYFESLTPTNDKPLIHHVGTNEDIEYWSLEMFLRCYTWTPITKEEAEIVKKLFNLSYGHFYYPEIDEEEDDD